MLAPGVRVITTERFSRLDGGYFLVSTYETAFGDEPAQRGVSYWGYDSDAKRFWIIFFSNNRSATRAASGLPGCEQLARLPGDSPHEVQGGAYAVGDPDSV